MDAEEIKALRDRLGCGARKLGEAIGVDQATILSWERGDRFPTKRHAERLRAIADAGTLPKPKPAASEPSKGRGAPTKSATREPAEHWTTPMADPALWALMRKLLVHPELRRAAQELAARYSDPADDAEERPPREAVKESPPDEA